MAKDWRNDWNTNNYGWDYGNDSLVERALFESGIQAGNALYDDQRFRGKLKSRIEEIHKWGGGNAGELVGDLRRTTIDPYMRNYQRTQAPADNQKSSADSILQTQITALGGLKNPYANQTNPFNPQSAEFLQDLALKRQAVNRSFRQGGNPLAGVARAGIPLGSGRAYAHAMARDNSRIAALAGAQANAYEDINKKKSAWDVDMAGKHSAWDQQQITALAGLSDKLYDRGQAKQTEINYASEKAAALEAQGQAAEAAKWKQIGSLVSSGVKLAAAVALVIGSGGTATPLAVGVGLSGVGDAVLSGNA
jgi:hypothetical protein